MKAPELNTIDDVLKSLDKIIFQSVAENGTSGYFAALYRQVTFEVKQGILNNYFDDGAWDFACELSEKPIENWEASIKKRDSVVAAKSEIVTNPKIWIKILLWIIRLGDKGTVPEKINHLLEENSEP